MTTMYKVFPSTIVHVLPQRFITVQGVWDLMHRVAEDHHISFGDAVLQAVKTEKLTPAQAVKVFDFEANHPGWSFVRESDIEYVRRHNVVYSLEPLTPTLVPPSESDGSIKYHLHFADLND